MASEQQVVLTRATRARTSHLPKAARSVVPAFLQKLYEMVSDASCDDLIRWSEDGDSFYVLDHERFAREVLGRWFKHQNSASFVRQLNMYGFHKMRHLQQGVLRSDSDTEFWQFAHHNFVRGQSDLLCLIQRKKQVSQVADESVHALVDPNRDVHMPSGTAGLSPAQVLDINSIVNGITAIKRHQTAISAELSELKESNEQLWQEAIVARERHKKHQDTINRILKFLAGVFGHAGGSVQVHQDDGRGSPSGVVVPRIPQRLMIAGARTPNKGQEDAMDEIPVSHSEVVFNRDQSPGDRFAPVETPGPTSAVSRALADSPPFISLDTPKPTPKQPNGVPAASNTYNDPFTSPIDVPNSTDATEPLPPLNNYMPSTALTAASPSQTPSPDAVLQSTFNQMLSNPVQLQRLLAALNSPQPIYPLNPGSEALPSEIQLAPFDPHGDFAHAFAPEHSYLPSTLGSTSLLPPPSNGSDGAVIRPDTLARTSEELQKKQADHEKIGKEIDTLGTDLNSLIQSLGLNPAHVDASEPHPQADPLSAAPPDFDFDSLWSQFASSGDPHADAAADFSNLLLDPNASTSTSVIDPTLMPPVPAGFLDDGASDGTVSPVTSTASSIAANQTRTSPAGSKRKRASDVAQLEEHIQGDDGTYTRPSGPTITKAKRKK